MKFQRTKNSIIFYVLLLPMQCSMSNSDVFGICIQSESSPGIKSCVGQQLLHILNDVEGSENFTLVEGVSLQKDDTVMSRSVPNFVDQDPLDYRSILENAGVIMGQRSMQIEMKRLYPGLFMKIGPTLGTPHLGVIEFVMDPNRNRNDRDYQAEYGESTGRILTRQFVVPFLLGTKIQIATLVPLILALVALLSKKALFLVKIAMAISSAFGFGGIGLGGFGGLGAYGGGIPYADGFGHPYKNTHYYNAHDTLYKGTDQFYTVAEPLQHADHFYDYEKKHQTKEKDVKVYERMDRSLKPNGYRTFIWQSKPD